MNRESNSYNYNVNDPNEPIVDYRQNRFQEKNYDNDSQPDN